MLFSHLWPLFLAMAAGFALWAWHLFHAPPPEPGPQDRHGFKWLVEGFLGRVALWVSLCALSGLSFVLAAVAGVMRIFGL